MISVLLRQIREQGCLIGAAAGALSLTLVAGLSAALAGEPAPPAPALAADAPDGYSTDNTPPPPLLKATQDDARVASEIKALGGDKPIYANDDRADYGKILDNSVKKRAHASVALFGQEAFKALPGGKLKLKYQSLAQSYELCDGERFSKQIAAAFCSGTLIAPDLVLTAGHCLREFHPEGVLAKDIRFVFGFTAKSKDDPGKSEFDRSAVFRGKEVVGGELSDTTLKDWAVVRLTESVPADLAIPVKQRRKTKIPDKTKVYVIGFPSGLPLKYAPGAEVRSNDEREFFVANLDTFGGNSGSGVYEDRTNELVGVLVRGADDYYQDQTRGCWRAYRCSKTGCDGEQVTRVERTGAP